MLFLPDRKKSPSVPQGWDRVIAGGVEYQANFVKVALNVVRRFKDGDNDLPTLLRTWFGASAGLPGTRHEVVAEPAPGGGWVLRPAEGERATPLLQWTSYAREQIPPMFGDTFSDAIWNAGFVVRPPQQPRDIFLLVTLDKEQMLDGHQYADHFLSPERFEWQSQNRTAQAGKHGALIREHAQKGLRVHLFIRPKKRGVRNSSAPFVYCGPVQFESWRGEKPITVTWKLQEPVPERLRAFLAVP
jgi:hypothetical protein